MLTFAKKFSVLGKFFLLNNHNCPISGHKKAWKLAARPTHWGPCIARNSRTSNAEPTRYGIISTTIVGRICISDGRLPLPCPWLFQSLQDFSASSTKRSKRLCQNVRIHHSESSSWYQRDKDIKKK